MIINRRRVTRGGYRIRRDPQEAGESTGAILALSKCRDYRAEDEYSPSARAVSGRAESIIGELISTPTECPSWNAISLKSLVISPVRERMQKRGERLARALRDFRESAFPMTGSAVLVKPR